MIKVIESDGLFYIKEYTADGSSIGIIGQAFKSEYNAHKMADALREVKKNKKEVSEDNINQDTPPDAPELTTKRFCDDCDSKGVAHKKACPKRK